MPFEYDSVFYNIGEKLLLVQIMIAAYFHDSLQIWVPSNPRGAERLPPAIIEAESDFYLRRLWGLPSEVCILKQLMRSEVKLFCFLYSLFLGATGV